MNPDTFSFGGLLNSLATGYGVGLGVSSPIGSGRVPTDQSGNPLATKPGVVGQPGTQPVATVVTGTWIPGVSNATVIMGAAVLGLVGLLVAVRK